MPKIPIESNHIFILLIFSFTFFFLYFLGLIGPFFLVFHFSIHMLSHASSVHEEENRTRVYLGVFVCLWGIFN